MHYVTYRSHQMQKLKIGIMYPSVHFIESVLVPLEHEKLCMDVLRPRRTRMHYVTYRSHRMQKHKYDITCPGALCVESVPIPPEHEK
jgi:hypothetical protein